ncbi:MAG: DmsC/YnfH family molybdoenzyme membrane anchor subunit [Thiobacillus sp.]|jgi:DMSO reductase anchor subunit|uniref:dimethyl sulfoxide reductase anchor subunit family protein n=1 Tax=Thiobacillus sp. TaxID=924 RepID=UPI002895FE7A|nr:DmsC/YnfH family molybdoenzyme membrane anchor subunit [Thiobacillus sp.]MDT3708012.1 DmsC/YnfH family molybdoenzyme membrane anchor subunit [Thiobacillus sp.]
MHPAFSVIFFTVASGAGFGLISLLFIADVFKLGGGFSREQLVIGGLIALSLIVFGLVSSTFHLANPKNAWRAMTRFRTSWLSREGVFAIAFMPLALVYLASIWFDAPSWLRETFGFLAAVLAWITVFSTGMIYACLKTIRQWNTPLVPANYLALGYASGSLLLLLGAVYARLDTTPYIAMSALIVSIAAVLKAIYYFWIRSPGLTPTINTATGLTRAKVKLLDAGHTHGTFLTEEFGFQIARRKASLLKIVVFAVGFMLPGLMLVWVFNQNGGPTAALVAVAAGIVGAAVERWLFFAEARHVVNLYHGAQRC